MSKQTASNEVTGMKPLDDSRVGCTDLLADRLNCLVIRVAYCCMMASTYLSAACALGLRDPLWMDCVLVLTLAISAWSLTGVQISMRS